MPATPVLLGKHVSFSIAPVTIAADGAITVGTSAAMTGKADSAQLDFQALSEDIRPLDANGTNWVPIVKDWTLTLSGIKRTGGTDPNPIETIAMSSDYAQVTVTTPTKIWTFQGTVQNYGWPIAEGRNVDTISIQRFETGSDNPTYADVV